MPIAADGTVLPSARDRECEEEIRITSMTADQAIHILHMHKHQARGMAGAPGKSWRPPPTFEQARPGILRKVKAILQARELSDEDKARDRGEYQRPRSGRRSPGSPLGGAALGKAAGTRAGGLPTVRKTYWASSTASAWFSPASETFSA